VETHSIHGPQPVTLTDEGAAESALAVYLRDLMDPTVLNRLHAEDRAPLAPPMAASFRRELLSRIGHDGWFATGWPSQFGGRPGSLADQVAMLEQTERFGAPFPLVTLMTVVPTLLAYGTEEQKDAYVAPAILGDLEFAIGYTEPGAGTDLASLRTEARLDGSSLIINGSKVFTSNADLADYIWLAVRTDPEAPKHQGLSIVIVPTTAKGLSITTIQTMAEHRTTATYYDDVTVPVANVVGELNGGWNLITSQLNRERCAMAARVGAARALLRDMVEWVRTAKAMNGVPLGDIGWVRTNIADAFSRLAAAQLFVTAIVDAESVDQVSASVAKVYCTEAVVEALRLLLEVTGASGMVRDGSPGAVIGGVLEYAYRRAVINTFGGGTNEIQREMIAQRGLGLPRVPR
jgi:alkylation response protein AidB-like acyl-CoA dehydrogenase